MSERLSLTGPSRTRGVPVWTRSPGARAGAGAALVLAAAGLIAGRADVAALALPLVLALLIAAAPRHGGRPTSAPDDPIGSDASLRTELTVSEAVSGAVSYRLAVTAPPQAEAMVLRFSVLGARPRECVLALRGGGETALERTVELTHTGPQELVRLDYRLLSADALSTSLPEDPLSAWISVAPHRTALATLALPRRLAGMVGEHVSTRAGEGGDFRDIHPFGPGDRLRRIDWRATARWGHHPADLYVRRSDALQDATVVLVIDARDDLGEQVVTWREATTSRRGLSSLDVAREAAGSIAAAYLAAGDRVGLQDLTSRLRMVRHGAGRRQLERLELAIERTVAAPGAVTQTRRPILPPGALVFLLSTLLDPVAAELATGWAAGGRRVIVIDTLPPARLESTNRYERVAHRMVMLERADRIAGLRARGIDVLAWRDSDPRALPAPIRLGLLSRGSQRERAGEPR